MNTPSHTYAALLLSVMGMSPSMLWAQASATATAITLDSRTPISSAPFDIHTPGSYYLTRNLSVDANSAITIHVDGVTVDLNGFTIRSTAAVPSGSGIDMLNGLRNLTIRNGSIEGGVVYSGTYSGTGFVYGIQGSPASCRASDLSVSGCLLNGIYLEGASVVESCTVKTVGYYGIVGSTVSNSVALECGVFGVAGEQVSNSRGETTLPGGIGLYAFKLAQNCHGNALGGGTGLSALTASNCTGDTTIGDGLSATSATNCRGTSSSGTGLRAGTAQGCQGVHTGGGSGKGLVATVAQGCTGTTFLGTGLMTEVSALNCFGFGSQGMGSGGGSGPLTQGGLATHCVGVSTTGIGTGLTCRIAFGCYGVSTSNWGIQAWIANSCDGTGFPVGVSAAHYFDMP